MILADHCVYETTIRLLQAAGYLVTRLKELADPGLLDPDVLQLAISTDRVLLTNDHDFNNILIYPPDSHAGVIVLHMRADREAAVHRVLLRVLADRSRDEFRGKLVVVDAAKYRVRT